MRPRTMALAGVVVAGAAMGATALRPTRTPAGVHAARGAQPANPCTSLGAQQVSLTPDLPTEFAPASGQIGADCVAWQTFIALNWRADPAHPGQPDTTAAPASFGTPGDTAPAVWESYYPKSLVFGASARVVAGAAATRPRWDAPRPRGKRLAETSKFENINLELSDILQALDRKWLTDQRGGLAYYEVLLNEDEFEFITQNGLTTAAGQRACATQPGTGGRGGFVLPAGAGRGRAWDVSCRGDSTTYGRNVGTIEVKAAWVVLPADHSLDYRYKTATATVVDPIEGPRQATVGLVGLHIIHRTPLAPQFVWATFEHVDNTPDQTQGGAGFAAPTLPPNANQRPGPGYTFFNPACAPAADSTYRCVQNAMPGTACDSLGRPAGCARYSAPMQIARVTPVDSLANAVTGYAWALLPAGSVFNYYRLINVQWPSTSSAIPPGATPPLSTGGITPNSSNAPVANTTMETFVQDSMSCMDCHEYAGVAQPRRAQQIRLAGRVIQEARLRLPRPAAARAGARMVAPGRVPAGGTAAASPTCPPTCASSYSFLFFGVPR